MSHDLYRTLRDVYCPQAISNHSLRVWLTDMDCDLSWLIRVGERISQPATHPADISAINNQLIHPELKRHYSLYIARMCRDQLDIRIMGLSTVPLKFGLSFLMVIENRITCSELPIASMCTHYDGARLKHWILQTFIVVQKLVAFLDFTPSFIQTNMFLEVIQFTRKCC